MQLTITREDVRWRIGWWAIALFAAALLVLTPVGAAHGDGQPATTKAATGAPTTPAEGVLGRPRVVRLSQLAAQHGLRLEEFQVLSGRTRYGDGTNRIAAAPGGFELVVNGRSITLPRAIGAFEGDLVIDETAVAFVSAVLGAPAAPRSPAPRAASATATAPRASTTAAPAVARPLDPSAVFVKLERAASLRPTSASAGAPKRPRGSRGTVVLDPGHGGKFTGAVGPGGLTEKAVNLGIARHLKKILEASGFRVVLTRGSDKTMRSELNADLEARIGKANALGAKLFVSIHANHASSRAVGGFEVYHLAGSASGKQLATALHHSMKGAIQDRDRGVKTARFRVLRLAKVPAALVEVGFLSNRTTESRLRKDGYRLKLARAIADGIVQYRTGS